MADTLGSVGVILSSLFIEYFGWLRSDPICSMVIAILIFLSVLPLLRDSVMVLLQRVPDEREGNFTEALDSVAAMDPVVQVLDPHVWQYSSSNLVVSLRVYVSATANEQQVISRTVEIMKEHGFGEISVQVEKELFKKAIKSYGPSLLDTAGKYGLGQYNRGYDSVLKLHH